MATITTRLGKGDPLTFTEMDDNLTNLNTDKLENINSESIGDLSDVDITTTAPTADQVLKWDNANSKFVPGDAGADLSSSSVNDLSDVDTTSIASGNILMWDAGNSKFIASSQFITSGSGDSGNVTAVDDVRNPNTITLDTYSNIQTGDSIVFSGSDVTSAGLSTSTTYYIHASIGSGEFELSNQQTGGSAISITDPGTISNFTYTHTPAGQAGFLLDNLGDVNVSGVTDGALLKYDDSNNEWVGSALDLSSSNIGDLGDVSNTMSPADGDVLQYSTTNSQWESAAPSGGGGGMTFGVMNVYGQANTITGTNNFYVSDGYGWTYNEDSIFSINTSDYYFTFASTGYYWFEVITLLDQTTSSFPNVDIRVSTDGGSSYSSSGLQYQFNADEVHNVDEYLIRFHGWIQVNSTSDRYIFGKSASFSGLSMAIKWQKIKD